MKLNRLISNMIGAPLRLAAGLALLLAPAIASAQTFENLDRLDGLVAITVGADIGQPGGPIAPIDRRLHLKPCPSIPRIEGPTFGAAIVSCSEIGWRIRVPLTPAPGQAPVAAPFARAAQGAAPAPSAPNPATAELVVKKGDPVELIAGNTAFSVSRAMIADEDGAVGQTIRLRGGDKGSTISAKVERAGVVRSPTI